MTVGETLARHPEIPFSRIPLFGRDPDDVDSVLLKADLYLAGARDQHELRLAELSRPITAVATTMSIMELFGVLVGESQHMLIVLDEYGGVAGVVTLEDVIETLLGLEIVDESDTTTDMQELARSLWRERAYKLGLEPPVSGPTEDAESPVKPDPTREV